MTIVDAFPTADALLAYVDRAYVINLPSRADRRRQITAELTDLFDRELVDRKVSWIAADRPADAGPFATVGTHGCFLSHLGALRAARDAGARRIAVFEDDAIFPIDARWQLGLLTHQLQEREWDYAHLGYKDDTTFSLVPDAHQLAVTGHVRSRADDPVIEADLGTDAPRLATMRGSLLGNHFYVVEGRTLDPLIHHLETCLGGEPGDDLRGPIPVDGAFNTFEWTHDVTRLVAVPTQAGQRSSRSDITPRGLDRYPVAAPIVSAARAVRGRNSHRG